MKIQFAFLVFHLAKDVKKCYCYNKKNISSNKGLMIYNSELVQNMQVSVEMFYKFFISNKIICKNADNKHPRVKRVVFHMRAKPYNHRDT